MPDEKDQQFTRMWNEEKTAKRQKFRNLMKSKLDLLQCVSRSGSTRSPSGTKADGRLRGDGEPPPAPAVS